MSALSPDQIAADWASKMGGARSKMQAGAEAVKVAPGLAAARQADVWANNTMASKPKYVKNVGAVTLSEWQQAYVTKGLDRVGTGAAAAQAKFAAFMGQLLPHIDRVKGSLPARGNIDANIARMVAFTRGMAQFQKQG